MLHTQNLLWGRLGSRYQTNAYQSTAYGPINSLVKWHHHAQEILRSCTRIVRVFLEAKTVQRPATPSGFPLRCFVSVTLITAEGQLPSRSVLLCGRDSSRLLHFTSFSWLQAMSKPFHCAFVYQYHPSRETDSSTETFVLIRCVWSA